MATPKRVKKPKQPSKPIDAREVFKLACRYCAADYHIRNIENPNANYMAPTTMALSAFATELLLKCLVLLENKEFDKIHALDNLFKTLSHRQQREIDAHWEAEARSKIKPLCQRFGYPSDLSNALFKCRDAFRQLRYGYENPDEPFFYLGELPAILWHEIIKARPDWESESEWRPPTPPTSHSH
jgi:hypothetical protein